jgi:hypothetical protein
VVRGEAGGKKRLAGEARFLQTHVAILSKQDKSIRNPAHCADGHPLLPLKLGALLASLTRAPCRLTKCVLA